MNTPFYKYGAFNDEISLILAFIIGIGFGFFLERAGFGSSVKLASQFYFTDMSVLKVMFSAIVTAMVGIYFLSVTGIMDLSLVYINPTYIVPQVIGGLVLGIGFVIGGYCPGTSCAAFATGKMDALMYIIGIFGGVFIFGELYPWIEGFYNSTPMGEVTLPSFFNLPYGLIVFFVCVMAIGAFAAAEWGEKRMKKKAV